VRHCLHGACAAFTDQTRASQWGRVVPKHPNHANAFRLKLTDSGIPRTMELRAGTSSFGAFEPNMFTIARYFFCISRTSTCLERNFPPSCDGFRKNDWTRGSSNSAFAASPPHVHHPCMRSATGCDNWCRDPVVMRCACFAPTLRARCSMCASGQTVPNHVFCSGLAKILLPNHFHVPRRQDRAFVRCQHSNKHFVDTCDACFARVRILWLEEQGSTCFAHQFRLEAAQRCERLQPTLTALVLCS